MSQINILLLNPSNNIKGEIKIKKPKFYQDLMKILSQKLKKNLSNNYDIFIVDKNNKEITINNEENYKKIEDILLIREIDKEIAKQSFFELNYHKLSESKRERLEDKYNCLSCLNFIEDENPYLCYKCQKIFHEKCLKDWDKKCKSQNKILSCPNCRNELPIEEWNTKLDYENERKVLNDLNINKNNINNFIEKNINIIKDKKVKELIDNKNNQNKLIKKYEFFIKKTIKLINNIIYKIDKIHNILRLKTNPELSNIMDLYPLNFQNIELDWISDVIDDELERFKKYLKTNEINKKMTITEYNSSINNKKKNFGDDINHSENKEINIKYFAKSKGTFCIFGSDFVKNNKENIEIIVNDKKLYTLFNCQYLEEGDNNVKLIIKKDLDNLSNMFYGCDCLKDITELKYLNVKNVYDFSSMFSNCILLSDITPLKNWNVSGGTNFSFMFFNCGLLSDLTPLKNWDVSNGMKFNSMFSNCSSLKDIEALKKFSVINKEAFYQKIKELLGKREEFEICFKIFTIKNYLKENIIDFSNEEKLALVLFFMENNCQNSDIYPEIKENQFEDNLIEILKLTDSVTFEDSEKLLKLLEKCQDNYKKLADYILLNYKK